MSIDTGAGFAAWTYSPSWAPTNIGLTGAVDGNSAEFSEPLTATISSLNIANDATFSIRWAADRGAGTGASQGIAIDNISLTAIPEPSTVGLLGLVAGALLPRLRRRA